MVRTPGWSSSHVHVSGQPARRPRRSGSHLPPLFVLGLGLALTTPTVLDDRERDAAQPSLASLAPVRARQESPRPTAIVAPAPVPAFDPDLLRSTTLLGGPPATLADSRPLAAALQPSAPSPAPSLAEVVAAAEEADAAPEPEETGALAARAEEPAALDLPPLPIRRPPEFRFSSLPQPVKPQAEAPRRTRSTTSVAVTPPADDRSFMERLFNLKHNAPPANALAYATPQDGTMDRNPGLRMGAAPSPAVSPGVAVYDISSHTLHLPSGERLEAHSGLGDRKDDPRFVHVPMKGPTPPHVYDLTMREEPFHGVRALRLNPVGGAGAIHGRVGLLAHTYLLGPNGDSNGCVSIRDYERFLQAYLRGEVKRLVVVARLG